MTSRAQGHPLRKGLARVRGVDGRFSAHYSMQAVENAWLAVGVSFSGVNST